MRGRWSCYWVAADAPAALVRLRARDYGLFGSRVAWEGVIADGVLDYRLRHHGVFTKTDTLVVLALAQGAWDRVEVRTGRGDIQVHPGPALARSWTWRVATGGCWGQGLIRPRPWGLPESSAWV